MNGYRKMMIAEGGNLSWCRPFESENGKVWFALNEGSVEGLKIDGEDVDVNAETLHRAAVMANDEYDEYEGYSDTEILLDSPASECDCCDCPWFAMCAAMDNPCGWENPDFPDDD